MKLLIVYTHITDQFVVFQLSILMCTWPTLQRSSFLHYMCEYIVDGSSHTQLCLFALALSLSLSLSLHLPSLPVPFSSPSLLPSPTLQVLCVHLKRFRFNSFIRTKLNTPISFPLHSLDMAPFTTTDTKTSSSSRRSRSWTIYDLAAVVVHHGSGYDPH